MDVAVCAEEVENAALCKALLHPPIAHWLDQGFSLFHLHLQRFDELTALPSVLQHVVTQSFLNVSPRSIVVSPIPTDLC